MVNVTVLIEEIPVIMTTIKTIVSKTVKRLKPNASHIERDILSGLCCELVDNAPLAQGVEALLSFVLCATPKFPCRVKCANGDFGACREGRSVANGGDWVTNKFQLNAEYSCKFDLATYNEQMQEYDHSSGLGWHYQTHVKMCDTKNSSSRMMIGLRHFMTPVFVKIS